MKIGIITHQYVKNYGAFLQCFALQEKIKKLYLNDEIYVVNYVNIKHYIINKFGWFRYSFENDSIKTYFQKIKIPFMFKKYEKKYFNLTKRVFNLKGINKLNFDVLIIGSDEVWNFSDSKSYNPLKFGYGLKCKKIITYAPSMGNSDLNNIPSEVKEGLKNISAFSVREDLAEQFLHKNNIKDIKRVVDPTFLYHFPNYNSQITDKLKKNKYILIYYCDKITKEMINKIKEFAKNNNYKIYGAGETKKWFDKFPICVNPFEWIEMFKNAEYIFTGTFHGTVFSIKSKKTFYNYIGNPSRKKKINSLLSELKISNRQIELFEDYNEKIEYGTIIDILNTKVEDSIDYIKNNIRR